MEMVPLLLIAVFIDNPGGEKRPSTARSLRWERRQDKVYALLAVAAFFTSLFVVSDVIDSSRATTAIVIAALSGTMTLLLLQIWRRFDHGVGMTNVSTSDNQPGPPDAGP